MAAGRAGPGYFSAPAKAGINYRPEQVVARYAAKRVS